MPQAVAYIRVSTEEQSQEGVSLEAQEKSLRAYCTMRGLELTEVVCDAGVSGGKPFATRQGGLMLLQTLRKTKEPQAVVAWKLDRLFRDCADCLTVIRQWDKQGVALHLVDMGGQAVDTSSAMGRFFLTVMAGAAELERNQVRERTSMAMQHKAHKGEYIGGKLPYGQTLEDDGVHLVEVDEEQNVIHKVMKLQDQGFSLRSIAKELERVSIRPREGTTWHPQQIKRMLTTVAA
jgi:DNA invertase Pin-like site-specific DNA recombinase